MLSNGGIVAQQCASIALHNRYELVIVRCLALQYVNRPIDPRLQVLRFDLERVALPLKVLDRVSLRIAFGRQLCKLEAQLLELALTFSKQLLCLLQCFLELLHSQRLFTLHLVCK